MTQAELDNAFTELKAQLVGEDMSRPSVEFVNEALRLIAPPGEKRSEKQQFLRDVFPSAANPQGLHISMYLDSYEAY